MPFTFAHPAIVLLGGYLPKRWISLTGLVAGSIAPDFEYFFRTEVLSIYSHTLPGIFWFDLPVALALSFCYHLVIKKALLENLPSYFRARFIKFKNFAWISYLKSHFAVVIFSMLVGVASHIFWDGFTHEQGFFVEKFKILLRAVFINNLEVPVYKLLQHGSSLIGMMLILIVMLNLPAEKSPGNNYQPVFWLLFVAFTIMLVGMKFLLGLHLHQYGNVVVTIIGASLLSLTFVSFVTKKFLN